MVTGRELLLEVFDRRGLCKDPPLDRRWREINLPRLRLGGGGFTGVGSGGGGFRVGLRGGVKGWGGGGVRGG